MLSSILISLEKKHADNIFCGTKRVEFRRRAISVDAGTEIWIYVKKPYGKIVGKAVVEKEFNSSPGSLWKKFSRVSGLNRKEFFSYFEGVETGCAIYLKNASELEKPVSLEQLRDVLPGFHPPQFFIRLDSHNRLGPFIEKLEEAPISDMAI